MIATLVHVTRAALAVAATPVTLAVDLVTLPASAEKGAGPFDRTADMLKTAGEAYKDALK